MHYEKQRQELDNKIRNRQSIADGDCYIADGIVNIDTWRQQKIRPLIIGKEAYDNGGRADWNYCEWLRNHSNEAFSASRRTWETMAYTSFGLQNNFTEYDKMPWLKDDCRVSTALQATAVINVGKLGGENTTSWARLNELYQQNATLLHDQIEFTQANVIIGWSTLEFFEQDPAFATRFKTKSEKSTWEAVDYWLSDGRLFIDAYHPAYLGVRQQRYVDSIVATVKKNQQGLNQLLPSWQ